MGFNSGFKGLNMLHTLRFSLQNAIYFIIAKAALKFGSEVWVLRKRDIQRLEAAQMKFLRYLLGITKLDKEKNTSIRKKLGHRT
jgi:hypothetical protein